MKTKKELKSCQEILDILKTKQSTENMDGMSRFGINVDNAYGVTVKVIKEIAKTLPKNHQLAEELWNSGIHEAQILSSLVDEYELLTEADLEKKVLDFDSWDVCDLTCNNLFVYTPFCEKKIFEWSLRNEEFVKRAAFVLIACAAVHRKDWGNEKFISFLPLVEKHITDERNFVKKAVNWALRGIGKKNMALNAACLNFIEKSFDNINKSGKWILSDAKRELTDTKILKRIKP